MTDYHQALPAPPPRKERKGWLFLLILIVVGGLGLAAFLGFFVFSIFGGEGSGVGLFGDRVAVVEIEGTLLDVDDWVDLLKECENSDSIAAVVVNINSPGGGIAPTQLVCNAIQRIQDEGKPVVAFMNSVAASGGYYVASAADEIYAMPGTLTGSIGVYMQLMNLSELLEKIGVEFDFVKKGAFKTAGDYSRDMKPYEREMFNAVVNDYYEQFLEAVAKNRRQNKVSIARGWNEPLPGGPVSKTEMADLGGVVYPSPAWGGLGGSPIASAGVVLSATSATKEETVEADVVAATGETDSISDATATADTEAENSDEDKVDPMVAAFADTLTDEQVDTRVAELAEGRIYTGRQAHRVGLVDELGTLEDAVKRAGKLAGIEGKPKTVTKKVKENTGLFGALKTQAAILEGPRFSYLCPYAY
ncbi:MAG: signal peptide peptidase SppA [Candidatus Omnitrophica bacterium]|nr:signal peptide peptidase SppA [Candidatus Omnitrophota bacterium]